MHENQCTPASGGLVIINVYNKKPLDKISCEVYNVGKESKEFKTTGGIN